jgi:hypothetical protein
VSVLESTDQKPFPLSAKPANDFENRPAHSRAGQRQTGDLMSGKAVLENVRRYRAIASLYRQTAAFRPLQKWSLLEQAEEWERRAIRDLESYFDPCNSASDDRQLQVAPHVDTRWWLPQRESCLLGVEG